MTPEKLGTSGSKAKGPVPLPSPDVRFAPGFLARVGRMVARVESARGRREGAGRSALAGVGDEFVGYRAYRPGESLRAVDWSLFARLDRPFVRVARREASERWAILVDTSASMGVGVPGKLQAAAEIATAAASLALAGGRTVELVLSGGAGAARSFVLQKKAGLASWLAFFERAHAQGASGLGALLREAARLRSAGRVIVLGDLLDLEPDELLALVRRGREILCAQILAPVELAPGALRGEVDWIDAETGARRAVEPRGRALEHYERDLHQGIERWRTTCARHRILFGTWSSAAPFEDVCAALLRG